MKNPLGTVVEFQRGNGFYLVECPEAPVHLRVLYLRGWQLGGAQVGDRVELTYQVTPSSGLWNVTQVLSKAGGER